ncbi:MAG: polysaccharide deacetylase family protein [Deltaproteobacteria bacterium]|nr:polysaccharide deacetylase family protein [Deltaproteobacteria bacterium]
MKAISLIYHDVIEASHHEASGFPGADAAVYKLAPELFDTHLDAIASVSGITPSLVTDTATSSRPLLLTFDDGGESAHSEIAPRLEAHGWRGHFFITAGKIGAPSFCDAGQIRDLAQRGHVVGSHSFSHPLRMAAQSWSELVDEWQRSVHVLAEILGEMPRVASIPGGLYSRAVARAAARAGINMLFTSEPVSRSWRVKGCELLGRYSIVNTTRAELAASIAVGERLPRYRQLGLWRGKQVAKRLGGTFYLKVRQAIFERRARR